MSGWTVVFEVFVSMPESSTDVEAVQQAAFEVGLEHATEVEKHE